MHYYDDNSFFSSHFGSEVRPKMFSWWRQLSHTDWRGLGWTRLQRFRVKRWQKSVGSLIGKLILMSQYRTNRFVSLSLGNTEKLRDQRTTGHTSSSLPSRPNMTSNLNRKVITTMVSCPLDAHTYCAWSAFTHLGLWRIVYDCSLHKFTTRKCILKCPLLTCSSTSNWLAEIWKRDF